MGIDAKHFRDEVIVPTLDYLAPYLPGANHPAAVDLLIGTAGQESLMGKWLRQIKGPALGIFQIEPATHRDNWLNYIRYRPELMMAITNITPRYAIDLAEPAFDSRPLVFDLRYATAMARIKYYRCSFKWPDRSHMSWEDYLYALGVIWDVHYNANPEHGFPADFVRNFQELT